MNEQGCNGVRLHTCQCLKLRCLQLVIMGLQRVSSNDMDALLCRKGLPREGACMALAHLCLTRSRMLMGGECYVLTHLSDSL